MRNEEMYIREKMGTRNPFTVPDGYFDNLAEQIIAKLPAEAEKKPAADVLPLAGGGANGKPAIVRYLRPLLYAAACVTLAIAMGTIFRNSATDVGQQVAQQQETVTDSDTYMDDMADYAMLDNEDIYASLLADL